jgi:hypothetical protein
MQIFCSVVTLQMLIMIVIAWREEVSYSFEEHPVVVRFRMRQMFDFYSNNFGVKEVFADQYDSPNFRQSTSPYRSNSLSNCVSVMLAGTFPTCKHLETVPSPLPADPPGTM